MDITAICDSTLNFVKRSKAGFYGWKHFLSTSYPVDNLHDEVLCDQQMTRWTTAIRNATKIVKGDLDLAEHCDQNDLVVFWLTKSTIALRSLTTRSAKTLRRHWRHFQVTRSNSDPEKQRYGMQKTSIWKLSYS